MKRSIDLFLALVGIVLLFPLFVLLALLVRMTSRGPALYWSDRVGLHNRIFKMPKFRTMLMGTPMTPTRLLENPEQWITPIGSFLRKMSLDELPQIWSILKGDMSFVGPRPALINEEDLISARSEKGVQEILPGLTGWAQVNGRDKLLLHEKVMLDAEYLQKQSFLFDLKILRLTVVKVLLRDGVSH